MPADDLLRRRLLLLAAQLEAGQVEPRDAVMLACDLLAEGASGPATVELAIQSPSSPLPERLVQALLAEWRVETPDAGILVLDVCERFLAGAVPPRQAGHRLLGVLALTGDQPRTERLLPMLDRLEYTRHGRADDTYRRDLEALAHELTDHPQAGRL